MSTGRRTRALFIVADRPDWDRVAIAAISAGVIIRVLFVFAVHAPHDYVYSDMAGYVARAMQVVFGGGPPLRGLALYPPGTHLLLAAPFQLFGGGAAGLRWADAIWFGFSVLAPVFAWRMVRLLLDPPAAALTAVLCAGYPLFILYSGFFTSETPTVALLCGTLWLGYLAGRSRPGVGLALGLGGGLMGGALVAVRPQFILNVAFVLVPLVRRFRLRWRAAFGFALGLSAVLAAVLAVNTSNAGHLTGVSENGGVQFYQAHCDVHEVFTGRAPGPRFDFGNPVAYTLHRGKDAHFLDHPAWDQSFYYNQGLKCVGSDPLGQVFVAARQLTDLTVTSIPWPLVNELAISRIADVTNVLYCAALLGILSIMALMWHRPRREQRPPPGAWTLAAQLAMIVPVTFAFGSEPRYRVPYDVFGLALLAWLIAEWSKARSVRRPGA